MKGKGALMHPGNAKADEQTNVEDTEGNFETHESDEEALLMKGKGALMHPESDKQIPLTNATNAKKDAEAHETVPKEINGKERRENYLQQLSHGKVKVYHARGMIVGCAKAGKTTLLKKLKGLPLKEILNTKPTEGVDIQHDVFSVSEDDMTVTTEQIDTHFNIKKSEIKTEFTMETEENVADNQMVESPDEDQIKLDMPQLSLNHFPKRIARKNSQDSEVNIEDLENAIDDKNSSPENNNRKNTFIRREKMKQTSQEFKGSGKAHKVELPPIELHSTLTRIKDTPKTITFFDFAGQLAYYVTHQIFLCRRAFYILVIDMTKDFDDFIEEEPEFKGWKYKDCILHWMNMIHVLDKLAKVILVATHAEGKTKDSIASFFLKIWELIPSDIRNSHLNINHQFPVEREKKDSITEIKKCILHILTSEEERGDCKQNSWGEYQPTSWMIFEDYLMNIKAKFKAIRTSELWRLNRKLPNQYQLQDEDMENMLQFFHDTGIILYFNERDLQNDIVLDVPWFVDVFKHIISPVKTNKDLFKIEKNFKGPQEDFKKAYENLRSSGILPIKLAQAIWKTYLDKNESDDVRMEGILSYMERLEMITKLETDPEELWYIQCSNQKPFSVEHFKEYSKYSSTLCFQFKYLPPSIYCRLVASCLNDKKLIIYTWPDPKHFYQNVVAFYIPYAKFKYCVLIGNNEMENRIEVQILYENHTGIKGKKSVLIKQEIETKLNSLLKTFHTNLERFRIGYLCTNGKFNWEQAGHFLLESKFKESETECDKCDKIYGINTEDVLSWWKQFK